MQTVLLKVNISGVCVCVWAVCTYLCVKQGTCINVHVCVCVDVRTHLRCSSGAAHLVFEAVSLPGLNSGSKLG